MEHRILIIEDNETNLELMVYLLEEFGYAPLTARDGEAGLAAIRKERPHLVLCDIQLPKMDGLEVARQVKADAELRAIPLVAITALAMVGDREKGLAAGFDGYISKPINPQTFVQQVDALLGVPPKIAAARPAVRADTAEGNKATILVVDDLRANTALMESLLTPFGYKVITASGMTEAMALARKHRPDLIISDVQMHEGNGYELCEAVKTDRRLKDIPVVMLTSTYSDEFSRQKGLALGAARYLFRPMDSLKLLGEIEDCLGSRK